MTRNRLACVGRAVLVALLMLAASTASAQGIAGTVTADTGGVLPGVTVEAASPALIEGVQTAFTDGQGLYNFTNLEAGTYSVTFTLPGFSTVIREGVELTANFTATIERDCTESSLIGTVNRSAPKEVGNNGVPVLYDELLIPFWSRLSFRGQNLLGLRGSV